MTGSASWSRPPSTLLDELGHQLARHRRVLELVARGADGHVEAGQVGPVVDRNPVVGHVVQVDQTAGLTGDAQALQPLGLAHHLGLPLVGEVGVVVVGVVDPFEHIAGRVFGADQDVVAGGRSRVAADVAVRDERRELVVVHAGGGRDVAHLLFEGAGRDVHPVENAGHSVDDRRVGSAHIHHHRCVDAGAVGEADSRDAAIALQNLYNFGVETILAAMRLAGPLEVVAREGGIVDVAGLGDVDRAADVPARGLAEAPVVGGDRWAVGAGVHPGEARADPVGGEVLVGDMQLVERGHDVDEVPVAVVLDDEAAGVYVLREPHLVGHAQVAAPVEPVEVALAGHRAAVGRGVVQADDRAGVAGRSGAGGRLLVHVEGAVSALGELEAGGGADDARADDDRVVVSLHSLSPGDRSCLVPCRPPW